MRFNTLFFFLAILVIVSFVVALPTDDFNKLEKRDLDSELNEIIRTNKELKGYSVDELKEVVNSQGMATATVGTDGLKETILKWLFEQALKKVGSVLMTRCRENSCAVEFCHSLACSVPDYECCIPGCPLKFPRVGGRC